MKKLSSIFLMAVSLLAFTGCIKPYDTPEYVEIGTSETAFVLPLEGDVKDQARFESEEYLKKNLVSTKRVQIPHRWNQTGRWHWYGEWIDTVRVVKVDRTPVTRQWYATQEKQSGSRSATGALWMESNDGVGFSMGFNCTAMIQPEDAAKFLYYYKGNSLQEVMDTEIKARYQQAGAEVAAGLRMDDLKAKKQNIVDAIEGDIIPFFAVRGITITTVGQFGGITYQNPDIAEAIEGVYKAQQEQELALAKLQAQTNINQRIELEAKAIANAAREKAKGEADGIRERTQAEADGVKSVSKALAEAQNNPQLIGLRALEVEKAKVEKWSGGVPQFLITGGGEGSGSSQFPTIILDSRPTK